MDELRKILGSPDRQEKRWNFEQYITDESHVIMELIACSEKL